MNRLAHLAAAVTAAALTCVLIGAEPAPAAPGRTGRLLVLDSSTGGQGLLSMRADGTGRRSLDLHVPYYSYPDLSPDGSRIAYTDGQWSIYTMDTTGGDRQWLVDGPYGPSYPRWSPDGRSVGFEAGGIWAVDYPGTGGGPRQIAPPTDDGQFFYAPLVFDWSPDGRRIAIVRSWQSGGDAQNPVYSSDIWILRIGGSPTGRQLTRRGESWAVRQLSWSPDGRTLAAGANGDLWSVDTRTGATADLTNTPTVTESNPVWAPDGRRIAFGRRAAADGAPTVWMRPAAARGDAGYSLNVAGQPTSWR